MNHEYVVRMTFAGIMTVVFVVVMGAFQFLVREPEWIHYVLTGLVLLIVWIPLYWWGKTSKWFRRKGRTR